MVTINMTTVSWNNFTFKTDTHPASPTSSEPGLKPGFNQWMPENVSVAANGNLQFSILRNSKASWEGQVVWAAAEAVLQQEVNYGSYYITFKMTDANGNPFWDNFDTSNGSAVDVNTIFGVFLYDDSGEGGDNPYREIDFIEVGFQGQPNDGTGWIGSQPGGPILNNAQFALQPWDAATANKPDFDILRRFNIDVAKIPASGEVTIACTWAAAATPVSYSLAYGAFDSSNFPTTDIETYTSPASVNSYVPTQTSNMKLHMNFWPYGGPSTDEPAYCQVTNLEVPG